MDSAVKGQSNQTAASAPPTNSQMDFLTTNTNAWKMAAGILMQEFSKIAKDEVETNNVLHQAQSETVSEQAHASITMANATIGSSVADAGSNFASATTSGVSATSGYGTIGNKRKLMNDHSKEIGSIDTEIKKHKSDIDNHNNPNRAGNGASSVNVQEKETKIKDLEGKKTKLKEKFEEDSKNLSEKHDNIKNLSGFTQNMVNISTQVGKGAAEAAKTQANAISSMDQQMVQGEQEAAKSAMDASNTATSMMGQIGALSVAAVRG